MFEGQSLRQVLPMQPLERIKTIGSAASNSVWNSQTPKHRRAVSDSQTLGKTDGKTWLARTLSRTFNCRSSAPCICRVYMLSQLQRCRTWSNMPPPTLQEPASVQECRARAPHSACLTCLGGVKWQSNGSSDGSFSRDAPVGHPTVGWRKRPVGCHRRVPMMNWSSSDGCGRR
jgi:hypothetical protein